MSTTAPSLPIPYVSVPVDRFEFYGGPSRLWIFRAKDELEQGLVCLCYMRLATGASDVKFQRRVEILNIEETDDGNIVLVTIELFGFVWSGRYDMHDRKGWVGR